MQVFRNMTENDIEEIVKIEQTIFSDAWTRQSIYDTYCQKQAFVTVAQENDKIIGYCIIYYVMDEGEIARIAVSKSEQHKRVGSKLLDFTCGICMNKSIVRVLLDVRGSNVVARKFYENYGFAVDGIRKKFYENPVEDAILMSKFIGE